MLINVNTYTLQSKYANDSHACCGHLLDGCDFEDNASTNGLINLIHLTIQHEELQDTPNLRSLDSVLALGGILLKNTQRLLDQPLDQNLGDDMKPRIS